MDGWMGGRVGGWVARKMNRILRYKEELWDPAKVPIVAGYSIVR